MRSLLHKWKWQDIVFSMGGLVLMFGLLPSVFSDHKPAPVTSLITALMLCGFTTVYASYGLWVAFVLSFITIALWFTLFLQVIL